MDNSQIEKEVLPMEITAKFSFDKFKLRNSNKLLILSIFLFCLLLISVFKNISYPLFWADESMTAIGTERVLQFGYPKVHDGKNVFYDLRHSNPTLGINEKDDAYVGGAGWGQYYFGIIGYKLAQLTNDIYLKTAIFRTTFAIAGFLGLLLIAYFISRFFPDKFSKYAFFALFMLLELSSVSLALLLREVRYYSLVIMLSGIIIGMYSVFRFYKPFNRIVFVSVLAISLFILYVTFAPVYFIVLISVVISEIMLGIFQLAKFKIKTIISQSLPVIVALFVSAIGVLPLLFYFKTFEISKAMSEFNGFDREMYWFNVGVAFRYFKDLEFLWLAIAMKLMSMIILKKNISVRPSLFKVSNFLSLLFIVSIFSIAKIPNFIYTRYIIFLQPILVIIIIIDFFMVLNYISNNSLKYLKIKLIVPSVIFVGLFCFTIFGNVENIQGHLLEMNNRYKGPLDFTIPFIQENFKTTENLVIAANYEETSYMYYLKSKVIIGYVGNNLLEDFQVTPHIIAYRIPWRNHLNIFSQMLKRVPYNTYSFPVYDYQVNNYAELNYNFPEFNFYMNHQFVTRLPADPMFATGLFIRK